MTYYDLGAYARAIEWRFGGAAQARLDGGAAPGFVFVGYFRQLVCSHDAVAGGDVGGLRRPDLAAFDGEAQRRAGHYADGLARVEAELGVERE